MSAAVPPADRRRPTAGAVLRRSLLVWGLGHVAIGDRRGWLLLALQVAAVAGFAVLASVLIQGSRWIVLLPLLLLLVIAWVAQAVDAYRAAIVRGAAPGGELGIAWLLPVVVAGVTAFWLLGGAHSTPEATLQEYVEAWRWSRPTVAATLFREPVPAETLTGSWADHDAHLTDRVRDAVAAYGVSSGLDSGRPFNALRFVELPEQRTADRAVFEVQITRRQRTETMLFGLLPTAAQETVVVEVIGRVEIRAHEVAGSEWLPSGSLGARLWLIEDVQMPLGHSVGGATQ